MPIFFRRFARLVSALPPTWRVAVLLPTVLLYGTFGFVYFESRARPELGVGDALWWAIVTMTTVGYGDISPTSWQGRFLVGVPLMLTGIGLLGYVLSLVTTRLVEAKNMELHGMASFDFEDHIVIANYPSLGKVTRVVDELRADNAFGPEARIVLIDEDLSELPADLANRRVSFVKGNPARDETLKRAAIGAARHAVILVKRPGDPHSDDHNLAVTLAVEGHTPKVRTIVECVELESEELLRKAGADSIVCIARFESHFITTETISPGVQDLVDDLMSSLGGQQVYFTGWLGSAVKFDAVASRCRKEGHIAIGVRRQKRVQINVDAGFEVHSGDDVITIGPGQLRSLT